MKSADILYRCMSTGYVDLNDLITKEKLQCMKYFIIHSHLRLTATHQTLRSVKSQKDDHEILLLRLTFFMLKLRSC